MTVQEDVRQELTEIKRLGIRVSSKALAYVEAHPEELEDYRGNGMSISEIADLVRDLSEIVT